MVVVHAPAATFCSRIRTNFAEICAKQRLMKIMGSCKRIRMNFFLDRATEQCYTDS